MNEQQAYIITTIILNMLIVVCWVWIGVLRWREGRTWHTYGCMLYSGTYGLLVYRNIELMQAIPAHVKGNFITLSYIVYMGQLAAVISFIINSYRKDGVK